MGGHPLPPSTRIVDLLDLADRTVGACLTRITDAGGIGREQWRILMMLDGGDGAERSSTGPTGPGGDGAERSSNGPGGDGAEGALADAEGRTMGEIAARAAVPAPTATRMVDRLVADGLAFRRSDPWDRRRVLVHVSPEGHALVESVASDLDEAFGTVLSGLDTQDRVDVLGVLARMNTALDEGTRARTP